MFPRGLSLRVRDVATSLLTSALTEICLLGESASERDLFLPNTAHGIESLEIFSSGIFSPSRIVQLVKVLKNIDLDLWYQDY